MATTQRKRWVCPTCGNGLLAPSRMKADDVRRFCLDCSKETGFLVERACPVLDAQREAAKTKRAEKAKRERAKVSKRKKAKAQAEKDRRIFQKMSLDKEIERITKAMGWKRTPTARITRCHQGLRRGNVYSGRWHITMRLDKDMGPFGAVAWLIRLLAILDASYNRKSFVLRKMKEIVFKTYNLDVSCDLRGGYLAFEWNIMQALAGSKWKDRWYE